MSVLCVSQMECSWTGVEQPSTTFNVHICPADIARTIEIESSMACGHYLIDMTTLSSQVRPFCNNCLLYVGHSKRIYADS